LPLPPEITTRARESVGGALIAADRLASSDPIGARALAAAAHHAFFRGFTVGCMVAAGVALAGSIFARLVLPARPTESDDDEPTVLVADAADPEPVSYGALVA
jgi:hypothetical protein